ncbi:Aryl-hydrocarbon-interacting protein-like 1 [Intoshia linei]|uniref:Aryl-hydrocarbon-interacting protein-like 1 n=1 Tax=Intoshia linei TaxID=1819745 RepID=A0A177AZ15_9BILA|nr:Aryl-hydrocarbon-interacting protein-like 1 [Intoshia linei]
MEQCFILKSILIDGSEYVNLITDSKVTFHYKIYTYHENGQIQIIQDTKQVKKTMHLYINRKFSFTGFEECIQTMKLNESSLFKLSSKSSFEYLIIASQLRNYFLGQAIARPTACCSGSFENNYVKDRDNDLKQLYQTPKLFYLEIEFLTLEQPNTYQKETWLMKETELMKEAESHFLTGNTLHESKQYTESIEYYRKSLDFMEKVVVRDPNLNNSELKQLKLKCIVNLSQSMINDKKYYEALKMANYGLEIDKKNVKLLYRRLVSNLHFFNEDEAIQDLNKLKNIAPEYNKMCNYLWRNYMERKKSNLPENLPLTSIFKH